MTTRFPKAPGGRLFAADRQWLFLLTCLFPAIAYIAVVALWPLLQGIWYSFHAYSLTKPAPPRFIGLGNYAKLFADPAGRASISNTILFTVVAVAIEAVLGMALALALWRDDRFNRVMLAVLLIPVSVTPLATALAFRAMLAAEFGPLSYYAEALGVIGAQGFFARPGTAFATIVAIDVFQWTPLVALILLAGLKGLPNSTLEAATIDGAGPWRRLRHIILPQMLPAIFLALMLRTMDAFRVFDSIFATTKGGPQDATNMMMFYAVKQGFQFFDIGYGSAISTVMVLLLFGFVALFILTIRRADRRMSGT